MYYIYPAVFHKDEKEYWVEFPDLEGCQTYENTLEKCFMAASEALEGYILSLVDGGKPIPSPSEISSLTHTAYVFVNYISCSLKEKSVKKTLTISERLNRLAEAAGINFSQTLQEALAQKLGLN